MLIKTNILYIILLIRLNESRFLKGDKMATLLLLTIIYIAFISLGIPDAILGVAWPEMRLDFGVPLDVAGLIIITSTFSTILSSLASGFLIKKIGTAKITLFSVGLTAVALIGISFVPSFYWIILFAIPLGFGAGSIDTALNNYVALHYKTHHMNWLHAFWGIGATMGPIIMSAFFALNYSWRNGYMTIGFIQLGIFLILLISLPLWKKQEKVSATNTELNNENLTYKEVIRTNGVKLSMLLFVIYCAAEFSIGSWGASYLVDTKNMLTATAGILLGIYYAGITIGRIVSGFISFKFNNNQLVLVGIILFVFSSALLLISLPIEIIYVIFFLQGIGLSPIFPSLTHETPRRFGTDKSQHVIGLQIASANIGASIFPALFGVLARHSSLHIYPYYILAIGIIMFVINKSLVKKTKTV
jgi:fucose permease